MIERPLATAPLPPILTRSYILAWLCRFFGFFGIHLLIPTLPLYLTDRGADSVAVGLVVGMFLLTATVFRPVAGYIVGRFGARVVLITALSLYTVASVGYAFSPDTPMLSIFRIIHGIGWSGCTICTNILVADLVPPERRGEGLGLYTLAANVAAAPAAVLGVWLYRQLGPEALFVAAALSGVLGLATVRMLDSVGSVWAPTREPQSVGQYARSFFTARTLAITLPVFTFTFAHGGAIAFLPLQAVENGLSNPGLYFTVWAITLILFRSWTGMLSDRYSRVAVLVPAGLCNIAALLLLAWMPSPIVFFPAAVLHALGYGTAGTVLMAAIVDAVPSEERVTALAQWSLFYDLGVGGGGAVLGFVLSATNQSYAWMYSVPIVMIILGLWLYVFTSRRQTAAAH